MFYLGLKIWPLFCLSTFLNYAYIEAAYCQIWLFEFDLDLATLCFSEEMCAWLYLLANINFDWNASAHPTFFTFSKTWLIFFVNRTTIVWQKTIVFSILQLNPVIRQKSLHKIEHLAIRHWTKNDNTYNSCHYLIFWALIWSSRHFFVYIRILFLLTWSVLRAKNNLKKINESGLVSYTTD